MVRYRKGSSFTEINSVVRVRKLTLTGFNSSSVLARFSSIDLSGTGEIRDDPR